MTKPITKRVKAWAVLTTYPKRLKQPVEPIISGAHIERDYHGCGDFDTDALGIYPTEQSANNAIKNNNWYGAVEVVVPCTITFTLPTPKKK